MSAGTRDYDVAILGAGLVGLSLATGLARAGLSVAIVDRSAVDERATLADDVARTTSQTIGTIVYMRSAPAASLS